MRGVAEDHAPPWHAQGIRRKLDTPQRRRDMVPPALEVHVRTPTDWLVPPEGSWP